MKKKSKSIWSAISSLATNDYAVGLDEVRAVVYEDALGRLRVLVEGNASELDFQRVLPPFLKLLFPQYVAFINTPAIPDWDGKNRRPDCLLVDANGNVDILELKRPFDVDIMLCRGNYRSNAIPSHELAGADAGSKVYYVYA